MLIEVDEQVFLSLAPKAEGPIWEEITRDWHAKRIFRYPLEDRKGNMLAETLHYEDVVIRGEPPQTEGVGYKIGENIEEKRGKNSSDNWRALIIGSYRHKQHFTQIRYFLRFKGHDITYGYRVYDEPILKIRPWVSWCACGKCAEPGTKLCERCGKEIPERKRIPLDVVITGYEPVET